MTPTVPAGARLTLLDAQRRLALRTLAPLTPGPHASVPVLASTEALALSNTVVTFPTSAGLLLATAELIDIGGPVILQFGPTIRLTQRRAVDRVEQQLEVLIAVPDRYGSGRRIVTGHTKDVSTQGLLIELDSPADVMASLDSLYPDRQVEAELLLPDGVRAPAMLTVVAVGPSEVRAVISTLASDARALLGHACADRAQLDVRSIEPGGRHRADLATEQHSMPR